MSVVQTGITPARTMANLSETTLVSQAVQAQGVKLLFKCMFPGDYRGSEHQPLVVPGVTMRDGTKTDLLLAASMSDDVWCYDASNPDPTNPGFGRLIWKQRIGNPPINTGQYDGYKINVPFWGALSCPYIDLNTQTMYVCCFSSTDQTFAKGRYYLHALSIIDGTAKAPPLDISASIYQSPGGTIKHDEAIRKQRSGLSFFTYPGDHDVIFICDSTFAMMDVKAHGFITACDVTGVRTGQPMTIACAWTASAPPYAGTGIWMAGQAPAIDAKGQLFFAGANGAFDPTKNCYGNAVVRLVYTPATASAAASLKAVDQWAPYTDTGLDGYDPTAPWIEAFAGYAGKKDGMGMYGGWDEDLGSAGVVYLDKAQTGFSINVVCACGKAGISYGLNADDLGGTLIGDFAPGKIEANYAKALWITAATYYNGKEDITPVDLSMLDIMPGGYCKHHHSTPPVYQSSDHGLLMFFGGENAPIRVFRIDETSPGKFKISYVGTGVDVASPGMAPPGGMTGTFMSISANGSTHDTALLIATQPLGDANKSIVPGRLLLFGANWFDNGTLMKLWDSSDWDWAFSFSKFGRPIDCNGKIYLPTYDAATWVIGLAG